MSTEFSKELSHSHEVPPGYDYMLGGVKVCRRGSFFLNEKCCDLENYFLGHSKLTMDRMKRKNL